MEVGLSLQGKHLVRGSKENLELEFVLKRINQDDILITRKTRDVILQAMSGGAKFVQVRDYTVMINSICAIEPRWGEPNTPPSSEIKPENISDPVLRASLLSLQQNRYV